MKIFNERELFNLMIHDIAVNTPKEYAIISQCKYIICRNIERFFSCFIDEPSDYKGMIETIEEAKAFHTKGSPNRYKFIPYYSDDYIFSKYKYCYIKSYGYSNKEIIVWKERLRVDQLDNNFPHYLQCRISYGGEEISDKYIKGTIFIIKDMIKYEILLHLFRHIEPELIRITKVKSKYTNYKPELDIIVRLPNGRIIDEALKNDIC